MDVNVGRYNAKHFLTYQSSIRHSHHPHTEHALNMLKPFYIHNGEIVNMNHFNQSPFIHNDQNVSKHLRQKSVGQVENENDAMNANKNSENVVSPSSSTKEKTPMCLVNEISRFNKIEQKYVLTNEEGPAHKKLFFVSLNLGTETFSASGQSIKKARHAAASEALKSTSYPKPPSKTPDTSLAEETNPSITPTVELNTLAMKRGETVSYEVVGGFKSKKPAGVEPTFNYLRGQNPAFIVKLSVGDKDYHGNGFSVKSARHSAASKALNGLRNESNLPSSNIGTQVLEEATPAVETKGTSCRSEVSRVYEIALKRNFNTNFQITSESGPAHMRTYTTTCTCGPFKVTGEGNSKRTSKRKSAEVMLEELDKLSPLPQSHVKKHPNKIKAPKTGSTKLNEKTFVKVLKASPDYGAGINPVSRLIQIQQAKKQPEPLFSLLEERGKSRDKEFHVQVSVVDKSCSCWAMNKKLAKRNATEKMLQLLGYSKGCDQIKAEKKVTFSNMLADTSNGFKVEMEPYELENTPSYISIPVIRHDL